jgi:chorismate mutase
VRSLDDVRAEFDEVDDALVALIARRQRLATEAGLVKRSAARPVFDAEREARGRARREQACAALAVAPVVVEAVFAVLIAASREAQR